MASLKGQFTVASSAAEQIGKLRMRLRGFSERYHSLIRKAKSRGFAEEYINKLQERAAHLNQLIDQLDSRLARDQKRLEKHAEIISVLIRESKE